jgi:SNF2 family DNA or RNA helicase
MPQMVKWIDREGAELGVATLIKDITIRHKFEECVDIPKNHQFTLQYHMSKTQEQKYLQMADIAMTSINRQVINAVNAASVMTKLMQIASGAVYDESGNYAEIDTGRYELVADLVQQRGHCVVFFNWKHQRDNLIKEFQNRGITYALIDSSVSDKKRAEAVTLFQKGFYKVLLAHPQSAAHGLTLTRGTSTIWTSPTYNLEHFLQGNKRIYRISQTEPTETIILLAHGTIEEKVYDKLLTKNVRQESLLSVLQEYKEELGTKEPKADSNIGLANPESA